METGLENSWRFLEFLTMQKYVPIFYTTAFTIKVYNRFKQAKTIDKIKMKNNKIYFYSTKKKEQMKKGVFSNFSKHLEVNYKNK